MKKLLYISFALLSCLSLTQCKYLDATSPAKTSDDFVTSTAGETRKTLNWCYAKYRNVAGGGNYNWSDPCSDVEYYPEWNSGNHRPTGTLEPENCKADERGGQYNDLYAILARCARIAAIIEQKPEYQEAKKAGKTNDWTQLYGECWTFYANCYMELVRHFGDVVFGLENTRPTEGYTLTSRFDVLDKCIEIVKEVEPLMYDLGQGGIQAETMNRTFANAIIGEMSLISGGYQNFRTDVEGLYGNVQLEVKYTDAVGKCVYARRTDWKNYYTQAQTYFRKALNEHKGSSHLLTVDDRDYADNPFQRSFQYIHDMQVSPESLFEVGCLSPVQCERPYSQGRPSNGGNSNAAPCKVFGGIKCNPLFYYGGYEDGDKRWDASAVITGADGKGNEELVQFIKGSRTKGGIAINKMSKPYTVKPRNSGLNYVILRVPNVMLMLAEVDAQLGDNAEALSMLNQLRDRAFGDSNHHLEGLTGDALVAAVTQEFRRETLGEGYLRWNEIRTGMFTTYAKKMRADIKTMIAAIDANGYYEFPNGRQIPAYVWIKKVHLDNPLVFDRVEGDPARCPGYRGVADYSKTDVAGIVSGTDHNIAVQGLFKYIAPGSAEALALEADGYEQTNWGCDIVAEKDELFNTNMLIGIETTDVPLYFHPLTYETLTQSKGGVTNGYRLPQVN